GVVLVEILGGIRIDQLFSKCARAWCKRASIDNLAGKYASRMAKGPWLSRNIGFKSDQKLLHAATRVVVVHVRTPKLEVDNWRVEVVGKIIGHESALPCEQTLRVDVLVSSTHLVVALVNGGRDDGGRDREIVDRLLLEFEHFAGQRIGA